MNDGLVSAVENVIGTALAIAVLLVARVMERRYRWLLNPDDDEKEGNPNDEH